MISVSFLQVCKHRLIGKMVHWLPQTISPSRTHLTSHYSGSALQHLTRLQRCNLISSQEELWYKLHLKNFHLDFRIQYILANDEGTVHEDNIVDIATIFSTEIVVEMAFFVVDLLQVFGRTLPSTDFIYMEE